MQVTDTPQTWFVTGCSSGLGLAIATAALRRGHRVVATARQLSTLDGLIEQWPDTAIAMELDVVDTEQTADVVARATAATGGIDVLVNNAGRVQFGAFEEVTDAQLRDLFDVNVFAPAALARAVLPQMRARGGGTIVQMSSMGAYFISPGMSAYTATKAALEGLSATLAMEAEPFGIHVLIVEPGVHRTAVFAAERLSEKPQIREYEQILGPNRTFITGIDGHQQGDPDRAAEILVDVVATDNPPLRLPLGGDACELMTAALSRISANISDWEDVARSSAYGAEGAPLPRSSDAGSDA